MGFRDIDPIVSTGRVVREEERVIAGQVVRVKICTPGPVLWEQDPYRCGGDRPFNVSRSGQTRSRKSN